MGELISKAAKIAQLAVVTLAVGGVIVAIITAFTVIAGEFAFGEGLEDISEWLLFGREIANNFIPAKAFNACIALWFTGSSALLGDYLVTIIGGKISGIR